MRIGDRVKIKSKSAGRSLKEVIIGKKNWDRICIAIIISLELGV